MGLFKVSSRKKEAISQRQNFDVNKKLVYSLSKSRVPSFRQLKYIKKFLSSKELWIILACFVFIFSSIFWLGGRFYLKHVDITPAKGGEYSEALIGSPKYINPLYSSINDVDDDLVHLIYSSLFKHDKNGNLVNDLVESYQISPDNKIYTFKLRPDVSWHNGDALTAEDVIFTFNAIKSNDYKSPLRQSFVGVEIEEVDNLTFKLNLSEPYAAFLDLLTFGILPQDLWNQVPASSVSLADLNLSPIGSGPYKVSSLVKDKSGIIRSYNLVVNDDYYGDAPKIEKLIFKFYGSVKEAVDGLNQGEVQGIGYLSGQEEKLVKGIKQYNIFHLKMPQLSAIFLNPKSNNALGNQDVRLALSLAIDKQKIINDVFVENARLVDGPILPDNFAFSASSTKKYNFDPASAMSKLDAAGWKESVITKQMVDESNINASSTDEKIKNNAEIIQSIGEGKWRQKDGEYLFITFTTVDRDENSLVAEEVKKYWQAVGVRTEIDLQPASQIQSDVIKQRNFDVLLYGQVLGNDPDLYAFWHSSQVDSPGLNIVGFSDKEADQLLEDARTTNDKKVRMEKYARFQEIISDKIPVIFMYSPYYNYLQTKDINGFDMSTIQRPYDRFSNISSWYIKTKKNINWKK